MLDFAICFFVFGLAAVVVVYAVACFYLNGRSSAWKEGRGIPKERTHPDDPYAAALNRAHKAFEQACGLVTMIFIPLFIIGMLLK